MTNQTISIDYLIALRQRLIAVGCWYMADEVKALIEAELKNKKDNADE